MTCRACWRRRPIAIWSSAPVTCPGVAYRTGLSIDACSRFANLHTRVLLRLPVRDCTSGYRCYSRRVLEAIDTLTIRSSGYSFLEEMVWRVYRAGFRIREVPIVFVDRRVGSSKIDRAETYHAAWHVLVTAFKARR